jgi:3-phenylpropionate/trans-cinnamate dioxygenase ferredoxin subunit
MPWHRLEAPEPLGAGQKFAAAVDGREVLVCRTGTGYFAIANRCTHAAWPLEGEPIEGMEIVCTLHGARFDLRDGCPTAGPASKPLAIYPVELRDGAFYVSL